ncbi:hypothetical protein [Slackia exigua]|uniref:hypothetical protein n=1 Tax=Slackia exigua TaxID=84109 RepID=UPI0023F4FF9B|nr:hypothetical protein [Slackia exigua]
MAFSKPATQRELDYIRERWKTDSPSDIADHLGRTDRFVYKKINDMHLREERDSSSMHGRHEKPPSKRPEPKAEVDAESSKRGRPKSSRERLCALRDLIWDSLQQAQPRDVPKLSEEYRTVMEKLEKSDGSVRSASHISDIISIVRPSDASSGEGIRQAR